MHKECVGTINSAEKKHGYSHKQYLSEKSSYFLMNNERSICPSHLNLQISQINAREKYKCWKETLTSTYYFELKKNTSKYTKV